MPSAACELCLQRASSRAAHPTCMYNPDDRVSALGMDSSIVCMILTGTASPEGLRQISAVPRLAHTLPLVLSSSSVLPSIYQLLNLVDRLIIIREVDVVDLDRA